MMNKPSNQQVQGKELARRLEEAQRQRAMRLRRMSAFALIVGIVAVVGVILAALAGGKPTQQITGGKTTLTPGNAEATTAPGVNADQWTPQATKDSSGTEMVSVPSGCFLMGDASVGASPVTRICFNNF